MVGRLEGEAVAVGMAWPRLLLLLVLFVPPSVLAYLRRLRGAARLLSGAGACWVGHSKQHRTGTVVVLRQCVREARTWPISD